MYGTFKLCNKVHSKINSKINLAQKNMPFLRAVMLIAFFSLSGCATTDKQNNTELDLDKFATITTHTAVNNIESSYLSSDINELSVYAPSHYSTAGKAIEDAKALLAQSQPRDRVIQKIAVAEAILKDGDRVMRKVKDILRPEISIKEKLDSLNSKSAYSNEYGSLNERFNKLILEIESGNTKENLNREKLLKDMQTLERKSLQFNAMNEPREILKRVKYRGGEQLAPITYSEALAVFKRAEEFIVQNPDYDLGITQMGREALFAAKRALYITEGVSALKQRFEYAPEQIILDEEYRMYRVARQLAELDYRDNSLEVQSELLAKDAATIALELENKDGLVIALRDTLIKVRDSSSQLTVLSDSAARLKEEKNQWIAKEALFKAKVTQLEENLSNSQAQLDFTQQKLLTFKADNARLITQSQSDEKQSTTLKIELDELKYQQQHQQQHQLLLKRQLTEQSTKRLENKQQKHHVDQEQSRNQQNITTSSKANTKPPVFSVNENTREKPLVATPTSLPSAKPAKEIIAVERTTKSTVVNKTNNIDQTKEADQQKNTNALLSEAISATEIKPEPALQAEVPSVNKSKITEQENSINAVAASAPTDEKNDKKERAKITKQETLEAILSAKELISSLKTEETRIAQKKTPESSTDSLFADGDNFSDDNFGKDNFADDEDSFVDASE